MPLQRGTPQKFVANAKLNVSQPGAKTGRPYFINLPASAQFGHTFAVGDAWLQDYSGKCCRAPSRTESSVPWVLVICSCAVRERVRDGDIEDEYINCYRVFRLRLSIKADGYLAIEGKVALVARCATIVTHTLLISLSRSV
jgi:hypothetical protein